MGSDNTITVLNGILKKNTIKILDLSKNCVTNTAIDKICQLIKKNNKVKELYLHWNQIGNEGAKNLFSALRENTNIKVKLLL